MNSVIESHSPVALSNNARHLLELRYLQRFPDGSLETPEEMFHRVAHTLAQADRHYASQSSAASVVAVEDRFHELLTSGAFLPNAPTLLGAGSENGQLFACFVLPVGDSIESIFDTLKTTALVHSNGGGTGFDFSALRGAGAAIRTGGVSSGIVSFLSVFDAETKIIKAGGTGWGANMGVLRCDHPDIDRFVTAKCEPGTLENFNLSVAITEAFMRDVGRGNMRAMGLFDRIADAAWSTGDPGLLFIDRINADNPTPRLGRISATNPCGEAPLLPYEACCLGGINVAYFDDGHGGFDWVGLKETAQTAVHMLDNAHEISRHPTPRIRSAALATRKIGIGVMGFADLLISHGIPYDSERAAALADELMANISDACRGASARLGEVRGSFPEFAGSTWEEQGFKAMRNACVTSNAPNSTISVIAGCSAGIEPLFSLHHVKQLASGELLEDTCAALTSALVGAGIDPRQLDPLISQTGSLAKADVPQALKSRFRTARDIPPEWHVRIQASFQRHTDLGTSKTINLAHDATRQDVLDVFKSAHELQCKGVTCYRDGSLERQFLSTGAKVCEECL